jgi:hypothetical protein
LKERAKSSMKKVFAVDYIFDEDSSKEVLNPNYKG